MAASRHQHQSEAGITSQSVHFTHSHTLRSIPIIQWVRFFLSLYCCFCFSNLWQICKFSKYIKRTEHQYRARTQPEKNYRSYRKVSACSEISHTAHITRQQRPDERASQRYRIQKPVASQAILARQSLVFIRMICDAGLGLGLEENSHTYHTHHSIPVSSQRERIIY